MKKSHPYLKKPDRQFWKKDRAVENFRTFDPVSDVPFQISRSDRVVTAGSCFAQHVARYMTNSGFNHFITEKAHPIAPLPIAKKYNYNLFSARYGNIYTARQLKQLLDRVYGHFSPIDDSWDLGSSGRVVDPFRPQIHPGGFYNNDELRADRAQHFRAVKTSLEQMDVFVFTLGLTEAWVDRRDGAVYPLAPGVAGGNYDPDTVEFRNFSETETAEDLTAAFELIRRINPGVKFIITVSPVPLNATAEDRHVFVSTTWSKAALRIAAERVSNQFDDCLYFPSYEVITSPFVRGRYYAEDCREVTPAGVKHVMGLFFKHFTDEESAGASRQEGAPPQTPDEPDRHIAEMEERVQVLCDEEAISQS